MNGLNWTDLRLFTPENVSLVPNSPGVYEFLQSEEYSRYRGTTKVLKIGMSGKGLRKELDNHFESHTAANRLFYVRNRVGIQVYFRYALCTSIEEARYSETELLKEFERNYFDLPLLNSQRGFKRDEDKHLLEPQN